ncbi:PREDICTED: WD repeat-containing protein 47-like isoform X2 [Priapulus caudatus]|uniref:WD repeat-containing protein 47-like isoform X2 n=1 Tax=Priapulus caudatus TaxID=37621 RepID=A0ABM1DYB0_PRICU|nr:PREDICTED: WD repeat-containing protein 47-like isoform X2 [Priapulus caudatus]
MSSVFDLVGNRIFSDHQSGMMTSAKAKHKKEFKARDDIFDEENPTTFLKVTELKDEQPIRAAAFHPGGEIYATGSNSRVLCICAMPSLTGLSASHAATPATEIHRIEKIHKSSVSCLAWSPCGNLIATGSSDKTIKLMRFTTSTHNFAGTPMELRIHDGAVRDLTFMQDSSNQTSLLISGGAGDCKIYICDCDTGTPIHALSGHTGHVLSLCTWGGAMFASGSHDRSVRFWDLRAGTFILKISPHGPAGGGSPASPACTVTVDESGRLLASGHEDGSCMLYDVRGARVIQTFQPHAAELRSAHLCPRSFYLLTGSFDKTIALTNLHEQGDLEHPLSTVTVGTHKDKVIQTCWHPTEMAFLSTSVDKRASLWSVPQR